MKTSRHLEQVLAHAASRLRRRYQTSHRSSPALQEVSQGRGAPVASQAPGGWAGREICARRAELIDVLLQYVFDAAAIAARRNGTAKVPLALVALGGYGRGELNPFSDMT